MRGVNIGYIKTIQLHNYSVIALAHIYSQHILIPYNSIVETNHIGLFNNTVIDIIPIQKVKNINNINLFKSDCLSSQFLCNNNYIRGYRGLNYDDLVRAATRISQRFDDPRFFQLCYLFLQNLIDISDEVILAINYSSYIVSILIEFVEIYLIKYII
uniref:Mce/MlaD domain-containing protein n=1 Tax=Compsothamnion thuioides TaxID=3097386 RepID=A0A4D6WRY3_9FLOR|nr:hypothetical protein [Compsothamnion thuyoides]